MVTHADTTQKFKMAAVKPEIHGSTIVHGISKLLCMIATTDCLTARAVTKTLKFHHITPILKSLHWLKLRERIKYKVLCLTYKSLKNGQPSYLRSLLSFASHRCTRSSSLITLSRPSLTSRLKIANRSFCSRFVLNYQVQSSNSQYNDKKTKIDER